ncbi:MAG: porin [Micavibrio aeruginosavorus]|uniref:Porin n=1 Tax=Micavibrio aeruginosavorus TaxID=349221 RepID=A0A7T5UG85_9BACT|nr:MAG: porin [Micavibrio aeruginosavorus]
MKKSFCSTAIIGFGLCVGAPAFAQGNESALDLGLGGYFRGYVTYHNQDTAAGSEERHFDIIRDTEIHMDGKTEMDNGLTVGVHFEFRADMGDGFTVDKSFMYASGEWGKVNFGGGDGVGYLMQVAAPSADSNIDGMRHQLKAVNYNLIGGMIGPHLQDTEWDYSHDVSGSSDKISYFSPIFSGLQAGVSYTPDVQATSFVGNAESTASSRGLNGVNSDDVAGAYGSAWELAARYEREIEALKFTVGAGYTHVDHEDDAASEDDLTAWNVAGNVKYGNLGFGVAYTENDNGRDPDDEAGILVVGLDYKMGDWKLGGSWYNREDENLTGNTDLDTDRYSGGAVYKYGHGMDFRASIHYVDHDFGTEDMDATSFMAGTQVNF